MLLTDLLYRGMPWTALMLERGPKAARLNLRGSHGVAAAAFTLTFVDDRRPAPLADACLAAAYFVDQPPFYALMLRRAGPRQRGRDRRAAAPCTTRLRSARRRSA